MPGLLQTQAARAPGYLLMVPSVILTRSPLRKVGGLSWVTTRVVPSSIRNVIRYICSPVEDEPVVPAVPLVPIAADPAPAALERGIASIVMTIAFGVAVDGAVWPAAPGILY